MKTASISLALVVVLGFVATAKAGAPEDRDYSFTIARQSFGIRDYDNSLKYLSVAHYFPQKPSFRDLRGTVLLAGPLGPHKVPFTATQGLIGCCVILAMLLIVPVVRTVRCRTKRVEWQSSFCWKLK